ncbi:class I SAM-dependent methyltransferase [Pseudoxanthomonas sp. PXM04]|uniref:class I SAM-dependent methyltransferase n=1 Tax=Pseudoxanthomonas sp. PXM04 TaxID=2769297 RepID=UPI001CE1D1C3|nr:class I SAM-dependent methyltransferase [Pseudoxanthomonas sp. PXM04]
MPAFEFSRQPDALAWFDAGRGQALLAAETVAAGQWLTLRPAQPALWLSPAPTRPPVVLHGFSRQLWLWRHPDGFSGDLRCELPLPLPSEAFGSIVVQHVPEAGSATDLLGECARVLAPGGRLRLYTLNPLSPYRWRWRGAALRVRDAASWQGALRQAGLHPLAAGAGYQGPLLRGTAMAPHLSFNRFRAVCVLEAEKRVAALIPPAPARRRWNTGAAHA